MFEPEAARRVPTFETLGGSLCRALFFSSQFSLLVEHFGKNSSVAQQLRMEEEFEGLSYRELQARCREKGLRATG